MLWLLVLAVALSAGSESDSTTMRIDRLQTNEFNHGLSESERRFNPVLSTSFSLVLPGAGQVYTGHYVKAGFFPALEGVFLSMAWFWHENAAFYNENARVYRAWAAFDTTPSGAADYRERALLSRYSAIDSRYSSYNFITWAVGAHLFNIFDAFESSNAFRNTTERNPRTAALLAAIPALGLGQLYNGSFSKAGMVMMGQASLGIMAYNSHRLMNRAALNHARLTDPAADSITVGLQRMYSDDWYSYRSRAFTNRNMYLWYSIFFYLYSMFDAVVDAYLHDYPEKMKIEPDLVVGPSSIFLSFSTTLRSPSAAK